MLTDTAISLAHGSWEQTVAFIGFGMFTIGFFVWVAYLVRSR